MLPTSQIALFKEIIDFFLGEEPQHKLLIILGVSVVMLLLITGYLWALALGLI